MINYHNITKDDMNNGEGVRVVLWVAGCEHHCPECHNPETWHIFSGIPFDDEALEELKTELRKDYVSGITFSGGDPLSSWNRKTIYYLMRLLKKEFPDKNVWVYTGYTYEELLDDLKDAEIWGILNMCDVLVDGKYIKDLRDTSLKWRGSSNQRVIDVKRSLATNVVTLHCD